MNIPELAWTLLAILVWISLAVIAYLQVPPVPTRRHEMDVALKLANILPNELVLDLGAGDGRFLKAARDGFGARVIGWELHPVMWLLAKLRLGSRGDVRLANLWSADVAYADVVFVFLMPRLMGKVRDKIWSRLKPGARLVSNAFDMPDVAPAAAQEGVLLYVKA